MSGLFSFFQKHTVCIYVYDPGLVRLTCNCFPVFCRLFFCFLDFVSKLGGAICMYICVRYSKHIFVGQKAEEKTIQG